MVQRAAVPRSRGRPPALVRHERRPGARHHGCAHARAACQAGRGRRAVRCHRGPEPPADGGLRPGGSGDHRQLEPVVPALRPADARGRGRWRAAGHGHRPGLQHQGPRGQESHRLDPQGGGHRGQRRHAARAHHHPWRKEPRLAGAHGPGRAQPQPRLLEAGSPGQEAPVRPRDQHGQGGDGSALQEPRERRGGQGAQQPGQGHGGGADLQRERRARGPHGGGPQEPGRQPVGHGHVLDGQDHPLHGQRQHAVQPHLRRGQPGARPARRRRQPGRHAAGGQQVQGGQERCAGPGRHLPGRATGAQGYRATDPMGPLVEGVSGGRRHDRLPRPVPQQRRPGARYRAHHEPREMDGVGLWQGGHGGRPAQEAHDLGAGWRRLGAGPAKRLQPGHGKRRATGNLQGGPGQGLDPRASRQPGQEHHGQLQPPWLDWPARWLSLRLLQCGDAGHCPTGPGLDDYGGRQAEHAAPERPGQEGGGRWRDDGRGPGYSAGHGRLWR